MPTLTDYERASLYEGLKKLAKWVPVGTGGYWEIRLWKEKSGDTFDDITLRENHRLYQKEQEDETNS